jgi:tetratricopeptide (TPR) repeat protein
MVKRTAAIPLVFVLLMALTSTQAATEAWIKEAYQRSITNEKIEDYGGAIKALSRVVATYPKGYTVNLRLGWLYYLNGRYSNSIDHYQTAQMVQPDTFEPLLGILLPLIAQTDYLRAEQVANQLLQADPGNYYGNLRLIEILLHTGKLEQALANCIRMRGHYPSDIRFLEQHAAILQAQGKVAQATEIHHILQTLDPDNTSSILFFNPQISNKGARQ